VCREVFQAECAARCSRWVCRKVFQAGDMFQLGVLRGLPVGVCREVF